MLSHDHVCDVGGFQRGSIIISGPALGLVIILLEKVSLGIASTINRWESLLARLF